MPSDPAAQRTLPRMLDAAVARYGPRPAIEDGDLRFTFAELGAAGRRAARAFIAAGIARGDRVAIWAPNVAEWVVAAIGAQSAGALLVPISTRFKGTEAAYVLRKSGARALFTIAGFLDTDYVGMLAGHDLPALERTVLLRGSAPGAQSWSDFLSSGERVPESEARARADAIAPDDLADMLFTSGTTGQPKGVMCAHGQNLEAFQVWSGGVGLREGDRYLVVAPFFHSFGYKAGWLSSVMRGATILPHAVFDAVAVLRRIEAERITVLPGPPTIYQSLLAAPDRSRYDVSSLRLAVTGAAAIPVELVHRMRDELGFETVLTAYGLTESCGVVSLCEPSDDAETIANTSGKAIPGTEVRCVDRDGKDVPRGHPGEIWVRGYNVMRGYFDAPEQTREAVDAQGWLHTGDVGVMDERGYLRITDRIKDMFIVGGFNCYPAEIENQMFSHEAIAQVAVIGIPDERMGEVGMAFVVPAPGHQPTPEALTAWCREQMANYKVPRRIEIVPALPVNAGGKVDKVELRGEPGARVIAGRTLWQLVEARAAATPDALFAVDERDRALSFADYRAAALRAAAGLHRRGVAAGMPVSWILPTTLDALVLAGALARLGAVQNPILPIYRERETRFVTRQTGARLLCVPPPFRGFDYPALARALAAERADLEVLVVDGALPEADPAGLPEPPRPEAPADAPVRWVLYTSGTSADPKGARHTDASLIASFTGMVRVLDLGPDDRHAFVFPVTHVGGIGWLIAGLIAGFAHITVAVFEPARVIPLLARHGVTLAGAGTAFHQAYLAAQRERPGAPIFPRVRAFPGGGAPKPPQLHYDLKHEIGGVGIVSGYGLTECPIIAMNHVRDRDEKLAHTEGCANPPEAELRVLRADGAPARAGEEGELRVRGPQLFRGYLDASLDADAFDGDGFFRTGDLGRLDADGYVVITGRTKDVIIRKGENISAKEIEDLLYTHPKVRDVAVIGLPDPALGERCCAVVARAGGEALGFAEMVEFLGGHGLMRQKIPEQLEIVAEVPRNAAGKIQKQLLRDRFS